MSLQRWFAAAGVAFMLVIVPGPAQAQEVGLKAGINFGHLTPEEDEDPDTSLHRGLVAGAWVRTRPFGRWSIQGEALFAEKGVQYNLNRPEVQKIEIRLRYLEIPIMVRADLSPATSTPSSAKVFVLGGLAPSFTLSTRSKVTFTDDEESRDIDDQIENGDVGLVGGLGVQLGRAVIEARYTHGLIRINEDDNGDEDRIKNRVLSVTFGFRFR